MKPKPIGIIGGAGPLAGVLLLRQVLSLAQNLYNCEKDQDFPKVFLISFPFSEMLEECLDPRLIRKEIQYCIKTLENLGAEIVGIACNTLHAFLEAKIEKLIYLPAVLHQLLREDEVPLVLCTSTSVKIELHKQSFPCVYPDLETQKKVDLVIEQTLQGKNAIEELIQIIDEQDEKTIVLGCTELSLYTENLQLFQKRIIDPLELLARKLLQRSFKDLL